MKYFISFAVIIIFLFFGNYLELPISVSVLLMILSIVVFIAWEFSVLKKDFTANFKMRSHRKQLNRFNFALTLVWSIILGFSIYDKGFNALYFYVIVLWWIFTFIDIMMNFVYKKKKPITVFINDDELILNERWLKTRNLRFLISVKVSTFSRALKLNFKGKSEVSIPIKEYDQKEFQQFLDILVEKSEHPISIPKNIFK